MIVNGVIISNDKNKNIIEMRLKNKGSGLSDIKKGSGLSNVKSVKGSGLSNVKSVKGSGLKILS